MEANGVTSYTTRPKMRIAGTNCYLPPAQDVTDAEGTATHGLPSIKAPFHTHTHTHTHTHMTIDMAKMEGVRLEIRITDLSKFFDVIPQDMHPVVGAWVGLGTYEELRSHTEGYSR